jgi:hypothetical protein
MDPDPQDRNTNTTMLRILYADQCDCGAGDVHSHAHGSHGALHPLRLVPAQQSKNIVVHRVADRIYLIPYGSGSGSNILG